MHLPCYGLPQVVEESELGSCGSKGPSAAGLDKTLGSWRAGGEKLVLLARAFRSGTSSPSMAGGDGGNKGWCSGILGHSVPSALAGV